MPTAMRWRRNLLRDMAGVTALLYGSPVVSILAIRPQWLPCGYSADLPYSSEGGSHVDRISADIDFYLAEKIREPLTNQPVCSYTVRHP
jgi:hypothetical protein